MTVDRYSFVRHNGLIAEDRHNETSKTTLAIINERPDDSATDENTDVADKVCAV
jgi:hypothetical protein